ncbi:MAG: amidohydrolase [Chloroflexota bacterium]|nr:amidohydrolase [Chloroflexota bacterium]
MQRDEGQAPGGPACREPVSGKTALAFWDCHAAIGRWTLPPPAGALDVPGLVEELARAGIAGALVHHGLGRDYDPAAGNAVLMGELGTAPAQMEDAHRTAPGAAPARLVPCVTLLPSHTGEFPPPDEHIPALIGQGVRAVRLYPRSHNFSLEEWCAGEILGALERHRLPLSIDLSETDWGTLHGVLGAHPALPVIVTRVNYRQERFVYPLLRQHPTLHVEVSLFQGHRAIEEVVGRFGPRQLLFGTGLPFYDAGAPMVMVARADVGAGAQQAIGGGNLLRLLREVVVS